jgi:hypothetical protein
MEYATRMPVNYKFGFLTGGTSLQDFQYDVSLHISHPDLSPELITRTLALQPTGRTTRKGEPKTTPKGTPREGNWEFSHWYHRFEITQDRELVSFLERLVKPLEPHRDFLRRIVDEDGEIQCFVGIFTDTNCDQILKPATLAVMHGSSFTGEGGRALRDLAVVMRETLGDSIQGQ